MFRYAALFGFTHSNYIAASAKNPAEKFSISRFNKGIAIDTKNNALRDTNLLSESSTDALMVDESARMKGKRLQAQTINPVYASKTNVL